MAALPQAAKKQPRWGQERRLEFIDFRLMWEGRINRVDLIDFFNISTPQASLDIAKYVDLAPRNLAYDKSEKVYLATSNFRPVYANRDAQAYLDQLYGLTIQSLSPSLSFIGYVPDCDVVRLPDRSIPHSVLRGVLAAIAARRELEITYQSMGSGPARRRWINPHAMAYDGFRWHTRAWCHEHDDFRDFVLARIEEIHSNRPGDVDATDDEAWQKWETVVLRPHRGLTPHQRRAVEFSFGMEDGVLQLPTRRALLFYLVQQLRLDEPNHRSPVAQQLEWVNESELRPLMNLTSR